VPRNWQPPPGEAHARQPRSALHPNNRSAHFLKSPHCVGWKRPTSVAEHVLLRARLPISWHCGPPRRSWRSARNVAASFGFSPFRPAGLDRHGRALARAVVEMRKQALKMKDILSAASVRNAMAVHAAVGGSTNLLAPHPSHRSCSGLPRPTRKLIGST